MLSVGEEGLAGSAPVNLVLDGRLLWPGPFPLGRLPAGTKLIRLSKPSPEALHWLLLNSGHVRANLIKLCKMMHLP